MNRVLNPPSPSLRAMSLRAMSLAVLLFGAGCSGDRPSTPPKQEPKTAPTGSVTPPKRTPQLAKKPALSFFAKPAFAQSIKGNKQVSISDIAEEAVKSVVNVRSTQAVHRPRLPMFNNPYSRRRRPRSRPKRRSGGQGSGVIVSKDGLVLTNHHVIRGATAITVTLSNDKEYQAKLVGSDPKSDVAVLRLVAPGEGLRPIVVGDSGKLRLGEVVLAIGNPFGVGQTVTMGIVSAKGRANMGIVDYEDFIQTDAAINPGNSGGALVNMRGELVGINTAILSRTGGNQGIGFAIPSVMARSIMDSLLAHGRVVRGWLGVAIQPLVPRLARAMGLAVQRGVLIADVQPNSPAARAGLLRGDVVVGLSGAPIKTAARFRTAVAAAGPKRAVEIDIVRGDKKLRVRAELGELPGERVASIDPRQGSLGGLTVETLNDDWRQRLSLPPNLRGVVVTRITPGSRAAAAGLQNGDVVLQINRRPASNSAAFFSVYRAASRRILMLVLREGATMYLLLEK